eukprot:2911660-Rhodomonas_salina.1
MMLCIERYWPSVYCYDTSYVIFGTEIAYGATVGGEWGVERAKIKLHVFCGIELGYGATHEAVWSYGMVLGYVGIDLGYGATGEGA